MTTTGSPTPTVSESGALPGGVTFTNNGNGTATLSGTPTAAGTYPLTLTAANGVLPNATQSFTLTVNQATQGLVAAYSFSEDAGTTVADASGNGNTGTIVNATWTTSGKYGDGLVFNGTNARVDIGDSASLHLTTGMTLEAWVNPSTVSSTWRDVIYKGNDNYFLEATSENSGGVPAAGATLGSSDVDTLGTAALTANTWAFLTETYNGSTLALYVNGTLVSSLAHTGNIATSTDPLQIGGDSIYGQYFQGMIDNVRIYNTALTQAQIQTDMTTAVTSAVPVVTGETPASGATGVATNTGVTATFNEAVQASSITTTTFTLKNSSGTAVAGTVAYNSSTNTATLTPSAALAYGTTYTATVSGAEDTAGDPMARSVTWSFTTATSNSSTLTVSAGSNLTTNAGSTVTFAGSVSGGTAPYTDSWNFGDGSTSTGNTLTPSHLYANPGTYTATLTATDSAKHSGSSSTTVTVNDVAPTVTLSNPTATVGVPVNFTATATDISPVVQAAGFTYNWNFGDSTTGTGASLSHTYSAAGTYTVSVTATDEYGKSGPGDGSIVV